MTWSAGHQVGITAGPARLDRISGFRMKASGSGGKRGASLLQAVAYRIMIR